MSLIPTARNKAIQYLAGREHSYLELFRKLQQKEYESAEIEKALDKLVEDNLLSDQRFGESYLRAKAKRGFGSVRIRYDLKSKGLSDAQIDLAFKVNNVDWDDVIEQVWNKKYRKVENSENRMEKAKQQRFLQYRGFTQSQISTLFHKMKEAQFETRN